MKKCQVYIVITLWSLWNEISLESDKVSKKYLLLYLEWQYMFSWSEFFTRFEWDFTLEEKAYNVIYLTIEDQIWFIYILRLANESYRIRDT